MMLPCVDDNRIDYVDSDDGDIVDGVMAAAAAMMLNTTVVRRIESQQR